MDFLDLARRTRSVRRFDPGAAPSMEVLRKIIEAASLAPCASNLQRLRYALITGREERRRIFEGIGWAALLPDWNGPEEGQRPGAYIVIMSPRDDRKPFTGIDVGIAAAYVSLASREMGLGCCMLLSFSRSAVGEMACPEGMEPELVMALGAPGEDVVLERVSGSTNYYRDSDDRHHVPKLPVSELIVKEIP